jgi:undecaprenol kinase
MLEPLAHLHVPRARLSAVVPADAGLHADNGISRKSTQGVWVTRRSVFKKRVYDERMTRRFLRSLTHALHGIRQVWREEANFRIQSFFAVVICVMLIIFRFSYSEAAIIVFSMMMVLGAEMFNTLVEDLLNIIEPKHHKSVGKMKDMMAGVVLLMSVGAVVVGALVFAHHFGLGR